MPRELTTEAADQLIATAHINAHGTTAAALDDEISELCSMPDAEILENPQRYRDACNSLEIVTTNINEANPANYPNE